MLLAYPVMSELASDLLQAALVAAGNAQPQASVLQLANEMAASAAGRDLRVFAKCQLPVAGVSLLHH